MPEEPMTARIYAYMHILVVKRDVRIGANNLFFPVEVGVTQRAIRDPFVPSLN